MFQNPEALRRDFDEIAELDEPRWNHNRCYFERVLRSLPADCGRVLDVGCGLGELSALAAERARKVVALDLSPRMIERARALHSRPNIEYVCADLLDCAGRFGDGSFDAIISTATAHHLPYGWFLGFAGRVLRPGGRLIVLDLARAETAVDRLVWGFAALPNAAMNLALNHTLRGEDAHSREVWARHGQHDSYMTLRELRAAAREHCPGAELRRLLFWRYLLVWERI